MIFTLNKSATDLTYSIEWSENLITWSTSAVTQALVPDSDNGTTQQIKASIPYGTQLSRRFLRLKVTRP
nr:hypothetical protein [Verrucomicrobiaceae bacterium]